LSNSPIPHAEHQGKHPVLPFWPIARFSSGSFSYNKIYDEFFPPPPISEAPSMVSPFFFIRRIDGNRFLFSFFLGCGRSVEEFEGILPVPTCCSKHGVVQASVHGPAPKKVWAGSILFFRFKRMLLLSPMRKPAMVRIQSTNPRTFFSHEFLSGFRHALFPRSQV